MASDHEYERPRTGFAESPGPAGDWTRRAGEAFADGSAFEAMRAHLDGTETQCVEWCPLCRGADLLRANASPELREHWSALQREALLTIRTLIDHYLERVDTDDGERRARVEDIPIE